MAAASGSIGRFSYRCGTPRSRWMASASVSLLAGRVSQPVIVSGSAGNGSGSGGAGLGLGGDRRSTGSGRGGCMASSAGSGWVSIRRYDRGFRGTFVIFGTRHSVFGVLENFQEFVTCTKRSREGRHKFGLKTCAEDYPRDQ